MVSIKIKQTDKIKEFVAEIIKYNGLSIDFNYNRYIKDEKHYILYSGGMESIVILYSLLNMDIPIENIILLNYKYDFKNGELSDAQKHEDNLIKKLEEIKCINVIYGEINLPNPKNNGNTTHGSKSSEDSGNYFSVRNSMLILNAASQVEMDINEGVSEIGNIYLGANLSESMTYSDNSQIFIDGMVRVAATATNQSHNIRLHAPLINLLKSEIWLLGDNIGVDWDLSTSCYSPILKDGQYYDCNECGSCKLRLIAKERASEVNSLDVIVNM